MDWTSINTVRSSYFLVKTRNGTSKQMIIPFRVRTDRGSRKWRTSQQCYLRGRSEFSKFILAVLKKLQNWDGAVVDGVARPPIQFLCADGAPCTNMILNNVNLWSATDEATNKCESAFGTGSCLHSGTPTSFAVTTTTIGMPAGFTTPPSLSGDLSAGFATNSPIPIP